MYVNVYSLFLYLSIKTLILKGKVYYPKLSSSNHKLLLGIKNIFETSVYIVIKIVN